MHQMPQSILLEATLLLLAAVATHLVISLGQTVLHRVLGHRRVGGIFRHRHMAFHHVFYARDHMVSDPYRSDDGHLTRYFLVPVFLVIVGVYFVLPLPMFMVVVAAAGSSFYAHVLFDRHYHVDGSWLLRFGWFRRKRELHFVHHRHANRNFAVIDFFWDRLLGTYRGPMTEKVQAGTSSTGR